jgi:hypothetical protein
MALNPNHEIPAFAEAASRGQAKLETISNEPNSNVPNRRVLRLGFLNSKPRLVQAMPGWEGKDPADPFLLSFYWSANKDSSGFL